MNPDVTNNITSLMSELQLQFLQHLKIQPLQSHIAAPAYQHAVPDVAVAASQPESDLVEEIPQQWLLADVSLPLVQDLLCCLQQAGAPGQWFYQAENADIRLTSTGLFSAAPQSFLTPVQKKQLWQRLSQLLPADDSAGMDLT